jgi:hypothetical protein
MQFPERHPLLVLYWRVGWVLILLGAFWVSVGVIAGRHVPPVLSGPSPFAPWHLAWWEGYGWGYGLSLGIAGAGILLYRVAQRRKILFSDRISRFEK